MEKSDIEILETDVGGQKIKDLSALAFIGFISRKIDGQISSPAIRELSMLVSAPPLTGRLSDDSKIDMCRKLERVGIEV